MAGASLASLAAGAAPAAAIPSPELVVGALSGLSQIGALLAALLGGGAAVALRRRGSGTDAATIGRQHRLLLAATALLLLLGGLNVYQWQARAQARSLRLEATLMRPSRLPGQPVLDPTLKELSFAEQSRHRMGLTTAEAERMIAATDNGGLVMLDIRETAEVEMGTFRSARAVRYPDLLASADELAGRKVLLFCHNGNRSSETCLALAARGIDCRFIAGGLEKWIVEGRTAGGFHRRSLGEVRAIPEYPNARRLLDTPEVADAVRSTNALFVDVRYPGEFAAGHLPGALNLPMRQMRTAELTRALASLPERPVIVPCYDRRSCFFGEILGLELSRLGHPFLGRYTVPWEYFVPNPPPPHIASTLAAANRGAWERAADRLASLLAAAAATVGFVPALVALALLSRLLVLPFSLKAERDQIVARRIAGEVAALKQRLLRDPVRHSRALRSLYRRHRLTPLRNQLALLMLPVLALSVAAAGRAAEIGTPRVAWIADLAKPDPFLAMPLAFALLFTLYIHWSIAHTRRQRIWAWLAGLPAFTALGAMLPAAAAIYLVASALLLLVQRAVVAGLPGRFARQLARGLARAVGRAPMLPTLAAAAGIAGVGNKAQRLGLLAAAGVPVPPGVVLDSDFLDAWSRTSVSGRRRLARRIARQAGGRRLAVRSSGATEDGADQSFAGVYESVLDVAPRDLAHAVDRVLASFGSGRAASYGQPGGDANIIVQRMVDARYAGVLFTRAPDAAGQMLVELVEGTADGLVSGRVTPMPFRLGRVSAEPEGRGRPPLDLAPLVRLGQQAEMLFGRPQDIEWTWRRGQFQIVQSRDITVSADAAGALLDRHWCDVLGAFGPGPHGKARLVRSELAEMLPRPTPLSLSLMEALYAAGGSVDLACRALGLAYGADEAAPPVFVSVLGRLYASEGEARRRAPRLSRLDVRRLVKGAEDIERAFHGRFAPRFLDAMALERATDYDRLETPALVSHAGTLARRFVTETHLEAEIVNILAELTLGEARRALAKSGHNAGEWLGGSGETIVANTVALAGDLEPAMRQAYLARHLGHRATLDYELAAPRFAEDSAALSAFVAAATHGAGGHARPAAARLPKPLGAAVARARRLQTLKEDAKHIVLMELAELRRALLAMDRRFGLDSTIFHLTLDEALSIAPGNRDSRAALARERMTLAAALAATPSLPATLTLGDVEAATRAGAAALPAQGALRGTRVAGRQVAEGRALVVPARIAEAGAPLAGFTDGDIIVTPLLHPAWLPEVLRSGGVVSETGGWLSHMAIVARERNVAMIVGAAGLERIAGGTRIRLELDGRIEMTGEGARTPRAAAE